MSEDKSVKLNVISCRPLSLLLVDSGVMAMSVICDSCPFSQETLSVKMSLTWWRPHSSSDLASALSSGDQRIAPPISSCGVLKICTLWATLSDAWYHRISARTGWPGVKILGEITDLICNFCHSVAAHIALCKSFVKIPFACCCDIELPRNFLTFGGRGRSWSNNMHAMKITECKNWWCLYLLIFFLDESKKVELSFMCKKKCSYCVLCSKVNTVITWGSGWSYCALYLQFRFSQTIKQFMQKVCVEPTQTGCVTVFYNFNLNSLRDGFLKGGTVCGLTLHDGAMVILKQTCDFR